VLKVLGSSAATTLFGGVSVSIANNQPIRIGVLLPFSGEANEILKQMKAGIESGIEKINSSGGVLGRYVEAVYKDSEGHPNNLSKRCIELVRDEKVSGVIGPFIAAGRKFAARHLTDLDTPLISATNHEGRFCHPNLFTLGPTPAQDVRPLIDYVDNGVGKKYFLVGSYPSWQNSMFRQSRFYIYPTEGKVRGQALTDLGEQRFAPILEWISQTDAEVVLFCIPRKNGALFIKEANKMGLLERLTFAWIGFNEIHHQTLDINERERIVTCSSFVMSDDRHEAVEFVDRVQNIMGTDFPVTYYAHNHASAVAALAEAWKKAGEVSGNAALKTLPGLNFKGATGMETIDANSHHSSLNLVIAKGGAKHLKVVRRIGSVEANAGCIV
tara:strand:- start:33782 stop:34933 length:1152 start_codon:yes stop_codon:yes gene_type:complete